MVIIRLQSWSRKYILLIEYLFFLLNCTAYVIAKLMPSKHIGIVYKKDMENFRAVSLTSFPWKVMEQIILETISKAVKDKMIGSSPRGY